mmetsp:Transcript_39782/g.124264  ORF Transcript_39782/g.124264 Transcript_39782/m.124264 type:complete len:302 (-) Transcript_39782:229-1134(-)
MAKEATNARGAYSRARAGAALVRAKARWRIRRTRLRVWPQVGRPHGQRLHGHAQGSRPRGLFASWRLLLRYNEDVVRDGVWRIHGRGAVVKGLSHLVDLDVLNFAAGIGEGCLHLGDGRLLLDRLARAPQAREETGSHARHRNLGEGIRREDVVRDGVWRIHGRRRAVVEGLGHLVDLDGDGRLLRDRFVHPPQAREETGGLGHAHGVIIVVELRRRRRAGVGAASHGGDLILVLARRVVDVAAVVVPLRRRRWRSVGVAARALVGPGAPLVVPPADLHGELETLALVGRRARRVAARGRR